MENIILKLLDEKYVIKLFEQEILPQYAAFLSIKKITIKPIKKLIWETTYHTVINYETVFVDRDGRCRLLPIYCSAHSSEPRKNVFEVLKFLWSHDFGRGNLSIPHPLFYSKKFNATFYRGVKGRNLYYYIKTNNLLAVEEILPKAAAWFVKLHKLPTDKAKNFNVENSRLSTVFPGLPRITQDIKKNFPEYLDFYRQAYAQFIEQETNFLRATPRLWLVHGDAHPENIIKMSKNKVALIDFTDLCLSDFARDLGTFLQQLEYMCNRKIGDLAYAEKLKNIFLSSYLKRAKIKLTPELQTRIDTYYNWTAVRTASYFLMKHDAEPERSRPLIEMVKKNLKIK